MSTKPTVAMRGISKSFGSIRALNEVDFEAWRGEIQAIVGENGAGKTTLMNILYGVISPDQGSVLIDDKPVHFHSSSAAVANGIGMVSQHYGIIPGLTCLQNLILGSEPGFWLQSDQLQDRAEDLSSKMGFQFQWQDNAEKLSPAMAQKLEILKLLWKNSKVMILDEPTALLSPADGDALFTSLKDLANEGATIILVTHKISEVLDHCQHVTVLRGGQKIHAGETAGLTQSSLIQWIVGESLSEKPTKDCQDDKSEVLLQLNGIKVRRDRGDFALDGVDFTVRSGEVVGIAGVDGNGQKELLEAIAGLRPIEAGSLEIFGRSGMNYPTADRLQNGLRIIAEDRLKEAIIEQWNLEQNFLLGFSQMPDLNSRGWINRKVAKHEAESAAHKFSTQYANLNQTLGSLSGGNQQRFVNGRAFALNPKLVLAFQPARGLDFKATAQVYEQFRTLAKQSKASVLVISYDLDELLENCDRVVVAFDRQLILPPKEDELNRSALGKLMVSGLK